MARSKTDVLQWMQDRGLYLAPGATWRDVSRAMGEAKGDEAAQALAIRSGVAVQREGGPARFPVVTTPPKAKRAASEQPKV